MIPEVRAKIEHIQLRSISEGYKKSKVGVIPDAWCCYQIHECLSICNYERKPISEDVRKTIPGPYPYYGPTQAQGYIATYESEGPAVLIGEDGDHFLKYKNQEMTMYVDGKYTVNNHAHVLRGTELCETKWFYYAYQHKSLFDAITRQGAGRYKLTKEALIKLSLQCPPIEEQKKIISILNTQDKVIKLKEKRLAEKQRQKKYLMQQLLTGKKRLPGFNGAWKTDCLGKLFFERKETNCENIEMLAITGTQGIIPRKELDLKDNSSEDKSKYLRVCVGDIGYNTMRMWQGVSAYSNYEGIVSPAYTILKPSSSINAKYFAYLFKMSEIVFLFYRFSQGLVDDTRNLKYENFKKIKVCYPPDMKEQTAIAEVLSAADREIDLLQQDIEQEKQKKKALMQLLLTGIVRVKT
mgnify:FL=1